MAGGPQFGFWPTVNQCLQNLWARMHLGLLLLLLWTLVILCYFVNTDSLSPKVKLSWLGEAAELGPQWESTLDFFFPTTCIIRENQEVVACNNQPYLSKSECLRSKCCFSISGTKIRCHAPLKDRELSGSNLSGDFLKDTLSEPTHMLRVFGLGVISMLILGFLPLYCCSLCRRRERMNRMLKVLKKQNTKMKMDPKERKALEERALLSS